MTSFNKEAFKMNAFLMVFFVAATYPYFIFSLFWINTFSWNSETDAPWFISSAVFAVLYMVVSFLSGRRFLKDVGSFKWNLLSLLPVLSLSVIVEVIGKDSNTSVCFLRWPLQDLLNTVAPYFFYDHYNAFIWAIAIFSQAVFALLLCLGIRLKKSGRKHGPKVEQISSTGE